MELKADFKKRIGNQRLEIRLDAGETPLALLGASGSGKSAVLRCIAGIMTPDEGRIILGGEPLFDSSRHINIPPKRRRVGFLFRHYALFPHMTIRQNIANAARRQETRTQVTEEYLHMFHLENLAEQYPDEISLEERLKTALARMMASEPEAILLDEPLAAPDSYLKFRLEQVLSDMLSTFDGPVIWASHDRGEVYRNCRFVSVLDRGVSQDIVTADALLAHPGTESAARLSGCKNFVNAAARGNAIYIAQWGVTLRCAYPLPPFLWRIGIRAHQVRISEPDRINAFAVTVEKAIEDVSSMIVLLRPSGAARDAPLLRMELEKSEWVSLPDKRCLTVSIGPQDILLLR